MEISMPDDLTMQLSSLGRKTDEITAKVLRESARQTILPIYRENLREAIGNGIKFAHRSTGELLGALGVSPAMADKNGNMNVVVGFFEPRRHQYAAKGKRSYNEITNAMIANVLEHGKHSANQPPRPFLKRTRLQSRSRAIAAAQKIFDEEVGKL